MGKKDQVEFNKEAHDKIFRKYNQKHVEIYNDFEQARLRDVIKKITQDFKSKKPLKILDFGAGTGNLSLKFIENGCDVVASDVSKKSLGFLEKIADENPHLRLDLYNGEKLKYKNETFDGVVAYSVLHHIPDYLSGVDEMVRVVKKGGFIYLDHEANYNRWDPGKELKEYYALTRQTTFEHFIKLFKTRELFTLDFIKGAFIVLFKNKRYMREGDIHVWDDDHVEWEKVQEKLNQSGYSEVCIVDYLMFKSKGGINLYNEYKNKCTDTRYIIYRKND